MVDNYSKFRVLQNPNHSYMVLDSTHISHVSLLLLTVNVHHVVQYIFQLVYCCCIYIYIYILRISPQPYLVAIDDFTHVHYVVHYTYISTYHVAAIVD